jgi:hypothetical protein
MTEQQLVGAHIGALLEQQSWIENARAVEPLPPKGVIRKLGGLR